MDRELLARLERTDAVFKVETLSNPRLFTMSPELPDGTMAQISCNKIALINTELHIRHGTALMLQNLRWTVTD